MANNNISLSLIIPVYNRPDEIDELLESLTNQTIRDFEVIIVEDGSIHKCKEVVNSYSSRLNIKYFFKTNSGPGTSRNYGAERASGNYFIILDSDCIIPAKYIETVLNNLANDYSDAFGGPDRAHESFSVFQKAVNYSMTSLFTTGGIRGKSEKADKFYPRSFNMGYSKVVFLKTGGFSEMRFGEDIDLSIRILQSGFKTKLIKDAFVYHKRRTGVRQFFKQVYNSGIARINLYKKYPASLKIVHAVPAIFIFGVFILAFLSIVLSVYFLIPILVHIALILIDSSIKNKSLYIGLLSIISSYIQFFGYGSGFIIAFIKRVFLKKQAFEAFERNFYK